MNLPDEFSIDKRKLTDYLLNMNHPKGGPKARFFLRHGFRIDRPETLARSLVAHALLEWPGTVTRTLYGELHALNGPMLFLDRSLREIMAVWEIRIGETVARFVTAYPQ